MQTYVSPPGIALGRYDLATDDIAAALRRRHPELAGHPDFHAAARAVAGRRRRRTHPCPDGRVPEPYAVEDRRGDLRTLMQQACLQALRHAGVTARDVGALVVVQDPAPAAADPFLDGDLVLSLGLPSTTARVPLTGLSSTGAVHALIVAEDMARTGRSVLVVAAGIHPPLTTVDSGCATPAALARQLMVSDGGAAVVVSGEALAAPGLVIDETWQYAQCDSRASAHAGGYRAEDHPGLAALPWLRPGQERPDFALVHPGGPAPLHSLAEASSLPGRALEPSLARLADEGDLGAASVLRMLARLHESPPVGESPGLLLGLAPGYLAAACRVRWTTSATSQRNRPKLTHKGAS
ncbi:hypothetical protein [Streptomyces sp. AN091965]|uniref:hypothetical protein n=1 Tax=Streptomyces sp. AN091965 TaxID=2927803 RepID=UPI001F61A9CC|nr:hypothetical protein [Streptomyces sp. AN091965]MCI3928051.1 hypothetical protein [Streptomyces sp. AN091965]